LGDTTKIGTVPFAEATSMAAGLFVNLTSRNSTACFDLKIASLARIAKGQCLREYKIGKAIQIVPYLVDFLRI
jgi:hypothetical protein